MTTISSARPSVAALWLFWGGIVVILAALTLAVVNFVVAFTGDLNVLALAAAALFLLLILPTFYFVAFGYYRMMADRRLRAAAAAYPGAYLLPVVIRPKISEQIRTAARTLGLQTGRLPWNNYAVFAADSTALRLFAGSNSFSERAALPTSALASAAAHPIVIGIRTLDCLVLGISGAQGEVTYIEFVPVRWQGPFVRSVPGALLPAELAAMKAATHPGI